MDWLWQHVALPTLGAVIEYVPWYVWVVVFGLLCALAWKVYKFLGWPGVIGIALAILTFGAYRQGWLNAVQRHNADRFTPDHEKAPKTKATRPTVFNPKGRKKRKTRVFNPDLNLWENIVERAND